VVNVVLLWTFSQVWSVCGDFWWLEAMVGVLGGCDMLVELKVGCLVISASIYFSFCKLSFIIYYSMTFQIK